MNLHERLQYLLENAKINQSEVADRLGIARPTVNQWLKGKAQCNEAHLARLVDLFMKVAPLDQKKLELSRLLQLLQRRRALEAAQKQEGMPASAQELLEAAMREPRAQERACARARGRTLSDFPHSFFPLAVISGDKREDSGSRINVADFGAVSASPAESRWIFDSDLSKREVEFYGDKIFVLENERELKARFSQRNLLVIGSPGSNHFHRRALLHNPPAGWRRAVPVFRFNMLPFVLEQIESFLQSLRSLDRKQLVGKKGDADIEGQVKHMLHELFVGGVLDPSYQFSLRAREVWHNRDFGLISLARNPFAADDQYVCILAAGFHMFGTAQAIRMLGQADSSEDPFVNHPLGGVIRVDMHDQLPFGKKFDESTAEWDTGSESDYSIAKIVEGLKDLRKSPAANVYIGTEEIDECIEFLGNL